MTISIKKLHQLAEDLREQGKFLEALKIYDEVIIGYQKEENYSQIIEALSGRSLTYKHLFLQTNDKIFAYLSESDAISSLKIGDEYQLLDKKSQLIFNLAQTNILFKNYSEAVKNFQKSLALYPLDDAQKGRYYEHLGEAQCLKGDTKNGLENLSNGLTKIRQHRDSTDSFLINVWESGCLMKLFIFTKDEKYLEDAQKIIDSDPRLIIRRRQLAVLL
jgi:tetratricopeptide (TPR) repeat protein